MAQVDQSMSLSNPHPPFTDIIQKIATAIGAIGLLMLFVAAFGGLTGNKSLLLTISLSLMAMGTGIFAWRAYMPKTAGIKNNGVWMDSLTSRGVLAWIAGIIITGFYVLLYWYPQYLGLAAATDATNTGLIGFFDPLSYALKGQPASEWFVYGTLYTLAILIFGFKFMLKYRHNRYQVIRTISVMFFQLGFAFLLPEIMQALNQPYFDFKNMWPLNYYFFFDWNINNLLDGGNLGIFMLFWGIAMIFIISPVLTYFYGKRWYCSWVCGCGGLAETAGDPFRHLSDKSLKAWKIERWVIHFVLVFAFIMTVAVLWSFFSDNPERLWISKNLFFIILFVIFGALAYLSFRFKENLNNAYRYAFTIAIAVIGLSAILSLIAYFTGSWNPYFINSGTLRSWYGFLIGAAFSGVVGVGFYPLMGSRVWCRFGCPMAAILGLQQRFFSRFRITTNGGQCISCGNCSTYCEMGIDVRAYAQKGQNIVRASCVGCGICAAVCPRGVLRLENGSADISDRTTDLKAIHISEGQVKLL